jgi:CubicO group peptidase (beta-lactamase class C family)
MLVKSFVFSVFVSLLLFTEGWAQTRIALPRSTPEREGVSSEGILNFVNAVEKSRNEMHGFMFLRHGKVIAEGWWNPYAPSLKHTMYSLSKSFTSTAVGLAVTEGRLKITDKILSFFPEYAPDTASAYLRDLTVRDLLTMSVGQAPDPTGLIVTRDSNWIRGFLALPIINRPGSTFLYNSMASYMLSAIVQKVTGQKVFDYLAPRLFQPLGIEGIDWETDPLGINTGGWGLRLKTEDMAKFGQLYLQKGKWKDRQIIPQSWVEEATSFKILQSPEVPKPKRDSSDWLQGYCYQFWRCRNNCFRGDGAFGQYIIVMPDEDAVVAITSETPDMQDELNLVWKYLLPAMSKQHAGSPSSRAVALQQKLAGLALPLPGKDAAPPRESAIGGKTFVLSPNERSLQSMSFRFGRKHCFLTMKYDTATYTIGFSSFDWEKGRTNRPGPYLLEKAKANRKGLAPYAIAGQYYWKDANTLELTLRYIESPHTEKIHCHFDQNQIAVSFDNSFNPNTHTPVITGTVQ